MKFLARHATPILIMMFPQNVREIFIFLFLMTEEHATV